MPPSGPRSRPSQPAPAARGANVRNEAFENIFGRPSGAHHQGGPSGSGGPPPPLPQPPAQAYGYPSYPHPQPPGLNGTAYLNPNQPSYPPAQAYVSQPQRAGPSFPQQYGSAASDGYGRAGLEVGNGYGRVQGAYGGSSTHLPQSEQLPNRRASLAPSTHSTHSTSYYASDTTSPPVPRTTSRMPSAGYPAQTPSGLIDPPPRQPNGSRPPLPPVGLPPTSAYQQASAYDYGLPSPASAVFPHRAVAAPSASQTSLPASAGSQLSLPSAAAGSSGRVTPSPPAPLVGSSRSPPLRRPTDGSEERIRSPPPDYLCAMERMGFDGAGSGPLDSIPGIPRRGEVSELGNLVAKWGDDQGSSSRSTSQPSTARQWTSAIQGSVASVESASRHGRMTSDSSTASSGGLTMTSAGQRPVVAPLSQMTHGSPSLAYESPLDSPTTPTGSEFGFAAHAQHRLSGRKSVDSTQSLPLLNADGTLPPGPAPSDMDNRATSFSGGSVNRREVVQAVRSGSMGHNSRRPPVSGAQSHGFPTPLPSNRSLHGTLNRSHSSARAITLQSMGHVYPALLSRVAAAFKQIVSITELIKDGITYKDAFDGRAAVGIIAEIIKTPDRNLALLLGRALDAQKFFHDVNYEHRLRDNPNELYQFTLKLPAPFVSDRAAGDSPMSEHGLLARATSNGSQRPPVHAYTPESSTIAMSDSHGSFSASSNATPATSSTSLSHPTSSPQLMTMTRPNATGTPGALADDATAETEDDLPVGVFTLLTDCYSPTCSRESLCYSINCPRRLEQMKRLNMKPTGLSRKLSHESIHDVKETGTLWIHSVSQEILDSVDDTEKKRQEAINEVIYTERDFVRDLEYLRDSWAKPLISQDIVPHNRRDDFVRQVFWNVHDVLSVNHVLAERLTKRQKHQPVVQAIGDIFLERVPLFEPFVTYGAHQLFGKYEFEKEKGSNPAFQKFVDETERKPESRKLELNAYLTKPTTRLGRYPLLLEAVLKHTPDEHADKRDLPEVIKMIKAYLTKVNVETGKSENIFELAQLEGQLIFRPNETIDLRLRDKNRELVHKGPLKRRGGTRDEIADLMGFLFDHAFLLVKPKYVNKAEQYRVYRRPIPLELLVVTSPDEAYNAKMSAGTSRAKLIARPSATRASAATHVPPKPESKHGFSLTIIHLGKKGYSMQLWVDTYVSRKKWLESIDKQQGILRERSCVFVTETITEGYFAGLRRINCISPYDNGNRMIYGTDEGVYFSNLRDDKLREPVKVIHLLDVTQVDVIEEFQLLIVLHERSVTTFPLDCLDPNDPNAALKRGKRIASHTSFFKSGYCLGKTLVAVVKSSTLSSTIKVLEPIDQSLRGKKPQTSFIKRLNGGNEALKLFKEFYIPTESSSVHFLKTKLCVGCTKGFEIVDLETLDMQGLLDPSDNSLDFVLKRDNVRPIAIYRIEEDFLLCYDEFAFYVNKNGWRSRPKWAIIWEGMPTAFALQYPYVIAFEPTFVEVHSVDTGHLVQIIPGNNITCLFADTPPSRVNAPPPPPNRQLMYPSPSGFRPPLPGQSAYGNPPSAPNQGFPPSAYTFQQGGMRPPPPPMGYGGQNTMQPPPVPQVSGAGRFARNQVIFTSEEGHVQFMSFPVGGKGGGGGGQRGHVTRPSR